MYERFAIRLGHQIKIRLIVGLKRIRLRKWAWPTPISPSRRGIDKLTCSCLTRIVQQAQGRCNIDSKHIFGSVREFTEAARLGQVNNDINMLWEAGTVPALCQI